MAKIFCKFSLFLPPKNDKTALRKTVLLLKGYVCVYFSNSDLMMPISNPRNSAKPRIRPMQL